MIRVTEATLDDIPQLSDLLTILFTEEAELQPVPERQAEGLRQILSQPAVGQIFAARDGETVVGMLNLLFTVSTALGGRVAILEDVVVRPESRNSGVGSALVREAIAHAWAAGCLRIMLLTDGVNDRAQCFYARHGFVQSEMRSMRLLREASS